MSTKKIILSRHVTFDEGCFPYETSTKPKESHYDFLETDVEPSTMLKSILQAPAATPSPLVVDLPITEAPTPLIQVTREVQRHPMSTRSKHGISKPKHILSLHTQAISPLPKSYLQALEDPNWNPSMTLEYDAIVKSETFDLVPRPPDTNIVRCMWLHKHKFDAEGRFEKHKSRLIANGKSQEQGVDFDETFSPVVRPTTIRTLFHVTLANDWQVNQLDVQNAFLHGNLDEEVYMFQPPGFVDQTKPNHVCKLKRAIYGLKQAPRAWNARFVNFITNNGFIQTKSDTSLFVYRKHGLVAYLILYVDDIILTASIETLKNTIIQALKNEFPMTDCGRVSSFLGVSVTFNEKGLFMNQSHYAEDIIKRAGMSASKPCSTPVDTKSKLAADEGKPVSNPTEYRSLAGALQYLTFTRPDISYAVQQLCFFMHDPREPHLNAMKRVIGYLQGTKHMDLQLLKSQKMNMTAYTDADWSGCPSTRRSTSGFCVYLGDNLISWSAKRQPTISRSSAEAEYKGVANAVAESCYLRNLLLEMGTPPTQATLVYCDNVSAVYLSTNPVKHQRTKHIEIDIHFVREKVQLGQVRVFHIPAALQYADIFTKGLPSTLFTDFHSSLGVTEPPLRLREGIR